MRRSPPGHDLVFKHQAKEEDFALRPEWVSELDTPVPIKGGGSGPARVHAGWNLFERLIAEGRFVDFEL